MIQWKGRLFQMLLRRDRKDQKKSFGRWDMGLSRKGGLTRSAIMLSFGSRLEQGYSRWTSAGTLDHPGKLVVQGKKKKRKKKLLLSLLEAVGMSERTQRRTSLVS
jgi:hypothetical protein